MSRLTVRIGLVDATTAGLEQAKLAEVAAVLDLQVTRDVSRYWDVQATVQHVPYRSHIPQSVWPIFVVDKLARGEGAFRTTAMHQPFAKVALGPTWTIDASRAVVEMIVDPSGNRLHVAPAVEIQHDEAVDTPGELAYLVCACAPCPDDFAYGIDGHAVSDFVTPEYYDDGRRFSFTGAIARPRQLVTGGALAYLDVDSDVVTLVRPPEIVELGVPTHGSLRALVDAHEAGRPRGIPARVTAQREALTYAARAHARNYP
jgi:hypothetical protein